jgi:hypothetical protein
VITDTNRSVKPIQYQTGTIMITIALLRKPCSYCGAQTNKKENPAR